MKTTPAGPAPDQLEEYLEDVARAHGYARFEEMYARIQSQPQDLDEETTYQLLKKLTPVVPDPLERAPLPETDMTGLARIDDLIRSVVRLIRVLLLGYTDDEIDELADRIDAERAREVELSAPDMDEEHEHVIQDLQAIASLPRPKT